MPQAKGTNEYYKKLNILENMIMQKIPAKAICLNCLNFRNSPVYLESVFKGMASLGSAYGSTRKDDGICLKNDVYLSADDWCEHFRRASN